MYVPDFFRQSDPSKALWLIREAMLAELVTWDGSGLVASELPMLYDAKTGTEGSLLGHLARANPQWKSYRPGVEALAIFRGPQAYVSPSWYATKAEHGKVVPTWDYATVHVRGELVIHDDVAWKRSLVTRLTTNQESPRSQPWAVTDAPEEYVEGRLRAIVGIELRISQLDAKWKLSQNQPQRNRDGVADGLDAEGTPESLAVARMIRAMPDDR